MQQAIFTTSAATKFYKTSDGWQGQTTIEVLGKNWRIHTCKRYNGVISTHCKVAAEGGEFLILGMAAKKDTNDNFTLNAVRGVCTEKLVKEIHNKSLLDMDAKLIAGELPNAADDYVVDVCQVVFSEGHWGQNKRVIYDIVKTDFGTNYHTVWLDGTKTQIDQHIRPASKKFGIGTYYNEGEKIEGNLIAGLLESAATKMAEQKVIDDAEKAEANKKAAEKAQYLSQFKKADRRTTTAVLKQHIYNTFPTVSKLSVTSEVYSMGDSMRVDYEAPEALPELHTLVRSFQYGRFDGMQDMYVSDNDYNEVIIDGYIMESFKFASHSYTFSTVVRVAKVASEGIAPLEGEQAKIVYNEKQGGVEIYFTAKPSQDIIDDIKRGGFRWSKFNKCWYKRISPSAVATAKKYGTIPEALDKVA